MGLHAAMEYMLDLRSDLAQRMHDGLGVFLMAAVNTATLAPKIFLFAAKKD
jgi:hypothetical protein